MISSLFPASATELASIDAICIGSGRFLRSVLQPALLGCQLKPIIIQTRGRTFLDYCQDRLNSSSASSNNHGFELSYEVDTVQFDGQIQTNAIPCYGAGTLGTKEGKDEVMQKLLVNMKNLSVIGIGVTEAGLTSSTTKAVQDLADILKMCHRLMTMKGNNGKSKSALQCSNPNGRICIICTDNVPNSGDLLKRYMLEIASANQEINDASSFQIFLKQKVTFHNTMVDRITSQRDGSNGMVPRAEPVPAKALVIEDLHGDLPPSFCNDEMKTKYGVVVRTNKGQLADDIALKLRVANGTHTAVAHLMALNKLLLTDALSSGSHASILIMAFLDSFFEQQILPAAQESFGVEETKAVYDDWRSRLVHAHFGLSTFFITQNGAAKGGIRIGPTIRDLIAQDKPVMCTTVFILACILRFLTPIDAKSSTNDGIYRGWLDGSLRQNSQQSELLPPFKKQKVINDGNDNQTTVTYADGLRYNLDEGWYEFRCSCCVAESSDESTIKPLPDVLGSFESAQQPSAYEGVIRSYLMKNDGGDLSDVANNQQMKERFGMLVKSISTLYSRMVAGDRMMDILKEMQMEQGMFETGGFESLVEFAMDSVSVDVKRPLHHRPSPIPDDSHLLNFKIGKTDEIIREVVFSEVASVMAIDLHTHLLPPSHGALCLWGIDELLTYHYLVAEYFMVAPPSVSPMQFYAQTKQKQADDIWSTLFIERTPVSEACRGVITTMVALGLWKEVEARDLDAIRSFYKSYRDDGLPGAEAYSHLVYKIAGIRYAIMTNIPFDPTEAQHWRPNPKDYSSNFRSAIRVDPLLSGDRKTIEFALAASGYDKTIDGAKKYLNEWCDVMKPEYMMASTPHDFVLGDNGPLSNVKKTGVNEDSIQLPGAFADIASGNGSCIQNCDGGEDEVPSVINESSDFLSEVLMAVCEERDLPVALKIGAHRKVNPSLQTAGDGVVAFADAGILARLCTRFPNVRFLATFLSRNNQHEACVLASKFRNLHLYGCWWFCNNPSIIEEITKMRVEMLGTSFTSQHSDARVLDQLIYKWSHSRSVIAHVMSNEMMKLVASGWSPTRRELRRDIRRLFGGSYEEFMSKSFARK